jgi:hypothetical protein
MEYFGAYDYAANYAAPLGEWGGMNLGGMGNSIAQPWNYNVGGTTLPPGAPPGTDPWPTMGVAHNPAGFQPYYPAQCYDAPANPQVRARLRAC